MKAEELRIGNLVFLKSKNKVYEITSGYEIDTGTESNDFSPIPLTEEWLLRLGFEQAYKSPMHSTYWVENLSYYFWYDKKIQYADCKGRPIDCMYVHQLQNLYFALTQKELTIQQ